VLELAAHASVELARVEVVVGRHLGHPQPTGRRRDVTAAPSAVQSTWRDTAKNTWSIMWALVVSADSATNTAPRSRAAAPSERSNRAATSSEPITVTLTDPPPDGM